MIELSNVSFNISENEDEEIIISKNNNNINNDKNINLIDLFENLRIDEDNKHFNKNNNNDLIK